MWLERLDVTRRSAVFGALAVVVSGLTSKAVGNDKAVGNAASYDCVLNIPEFVKGWKISRQFTLDVANAMPADQWGFRPNRDEMTFGEQMLHIAGSNVIRFHEITNIPAPFDFDPEKLPAADKESVVKLIEQSFDYVIRVLPQITPAELTRTWQIPSWKARPNPDGRAMVLNMYVHTAHHRAQCEVYLRVKGIKPPNYGF